MDLKNVRDNEFIILNSCCFRPTILKHHWLSDDDLRVKGNMASKLQIETIPVDNNLWGIKKLIDNGIDSPDVFFDEDCKSIFKGMLNLNMRDEEINIVTLGLEVNQIRPQSLRLTADLFDREFTRNIDHYIDVMLATQMFLKLHSEIKIIEGKMVSTNDMNDDEIFERISKLKDFRKQKKEREKCRTDNGGAAKWIENIIQNEGNKVEIYKTGIDLIDEAIGGGMLLTKLITIGARPGCGKTALATNLMLSFARQKARCLYISMELTESEILNRVISTAAMVNIQKFSTLTFDEREMDRIVSFTEEMSRLPMTVNSKTKAKWSAIESAIRIEKEINDLKFVFIDYVQQCHVHGIVQKREQIEHITNACKQMALELDITVIICAQLNRNSETEKRDPTMADLKDAGGIEQDSDIILLLWDTLKDGQDKIINLKFGKNRSGSSSTNSMVETDLSINKFFANEDEATKYRFRRR
jgi:replicative DNA helicase